MAPSTLRVSAIQKLHRPGALPHVLDALETAHALGIEDISVAKLEVQAKTGRAKPPSAVLHVLAVGIDNFGDKARGLHLDHGAEDARDVAKMPGMTRVVRLGTVLTPRTRLRGLQRNAWL
jgi:hypothetical protein